jgi:hypothetical protein
MFRIILRRFDSVHCLHIDGSDFVDLEHNYGWITPDGYVNVGS